MTEVRSRELGVKCSCWDIVCQSESAADFKGVGEDTRCPSHSADKVCVLR